MSEMIKPDEQVIAETRAWIEKVVIGCNFCPFAAREFRRGTIRYVVEGTGNLKSILEMLAGEFLRLDDDSGIETTLIILKKSHEHFNQYLHLIELCQDLLEGEDYEGTYQIASFHPDYLFAGSSDNDPSNFTNRSVYPMIHILREDSITKAIEHFDHPEDIPSRNIQFAKDKGLVYMQILRDSCIEGGVV